MKSLRFIMAFLLVCVHIPAYGASACGTSFSKADILPTVELGRLKVEYKDGSETVESLVKLIEASHPDFVALENSAQAREAWKLFMIDVLSKSEMVGKIKESGERNAMIITAAAIRLDLPVKTKDAEYLKTASAATVARMFKFWQGLEASLQRPVSKKQIAAAMKFANTEGERSSTQLIESGFSEFEIAQVERIAF